MSSGEGEGKVVCVTGASGYIASWLVKLLLQRGYTVKATVRNLSDGRKTEHLKALEGAEGRLELFEAELMEEGSFDAAVHGCDGVFHTASPVIIETANPQTEVIDPAVKGSVNVLRSCSKTASVKRVVLTSSTAAVMFSFNHFGPGVVVDETWVSDPHFCQQNKQWYCLSKLLAEEAARKFAQENGIDLVVMNPSFVIGPLLHPSINTTTQFLLDILKGKALFPYYQFVGVRDVAHAHIMGFEKSSASGRYILVGKTMTHHQLLQILHNLYPASIKAPINGDDDDKTGEVSTRRAESLGVSFRNVEVSLKDSIESFKEKKFLNNF